jgi:hypothetical protein
MIPDMLARWPLLAVVAMATACSGSESSQPPPGPSPLSCDAGLEAIDGRCVDPATRYEPEERLDIDNVVSFGDGPSQLDLPEPPKAGFRLVMTPVELDPGEEQTFCVAWPFPAQKRDLVYAAKIYTSGGLHHSNVYSSVIDPQLGNNPYPGCHPGADDVFAQIGEGIPDVLFANSTQVQGAETLLFPAGMAYRLHLDREVVANVHLLNTTPEPITAEVVYDFYTMPEDALEEELVPLVLDNEVIDVPAMQTGTSEADCPVWNGSIVSLMPHNHEFTDRFLVETIDANEQSTVIYEKTGFDTDTDIAVFDEPISLDSVDRLRFSCRYVNTKSEPLGYGLGDQEMCILFGYMFPPSEQFAGYQLDAEEGCTTVKIGLFQ